MGSIRISNRPLSGPSIGRKFAFSRIAHEIDSPDFVATIGTNESLERDAGIESIPRQVVRKTLVGIVAGRDFNRGEMERSDVPLTGNRAYLPLTGL